MKRAAVLVAARRPDLPDQTASSSPPLRSHQTPNDLRKRKFLFLNYCRARCLGSIIQSLSEECHVHQRKESAIVFQRWAVCLAAGALSVRTAILPQPVIK
jgi:hypothetical protein